MPKVLWRGTDVGDLANVALPARWVLKPNHRSGHVSFGLGSPDIVGLRQTTAGWLDEENNAAIGEWAYGEARRLLLVEEVIGSAENLPADYKFYVFDGRVRLIQVDRERFREGHSRRHYWPDWTPVDLRVDLPAGGEVAKPTELERMLEIASVIGAPFDFMRVDLYNVDGEVFFGEVTPYPASGHGRYEPSSLDALLGSYWTRPTWAEVRGTRQSGGKVLRRGALRLRTNASPKGGQTSGR